MNQMTFVSPPSAPPPPLPLAFAVTAASFAGLLPAVLRWNW